MFFYSHVTPDRMPGLRYTGLVLGEQAAEGQIMAQLEDAIGPEAAEVVETAVINSQLDQSGLLPTIIGIAAILIGASTVFAQMQQSLNRIWAVAARPTRNSMLLFIRSRVLSLTIVLAIGFILLVSLLRWKDVLLGALLTAVLFTLGRSLIAMYLVNTATASTYGAAGSLVLLLLWVNYSSLILLFGAAFTRAHLEARGLPVRPRATAVGVHHELIVDSPDARG